MKRCSKFLGTLLLSAAAACVLSSCFTTPEPKHVYDYGDEEEVTKLPHTRPESFEGNPFGNMPQSR